MRMFRATILVKAKKLETPKCPSIGEWINTLCYIHTMEYKTVVKIHKSKVHIQEWMDLKNGN